MAGRHLVAIVGWAAACAACSERSFAAPGGVATTCQPVDADRGQCRTPLDRSLCAGVWEARPTPPCGLRVYEGPGAGYLLQYVSYADIPPVGGPSWMCVYDDATHDLVGAWALDHYPRWCCGSSFDMFQGVGSDEIAAVAVSMATHPPCPDAGP
ncbi:MAG TPA: hypothetical protein VIF57_02065 [Polyangia bacterium]|jgi:hypothetical protein